MLLPPVYAKIEDSRSATGWQWQCSTHISEMPFVTRNDEFPTWITSEEFTGAGRRPVNLRQFLHESCRPFERGEQIHAKNVVYYLLIKNPDYSKVTGVQVNWLWLFKNYNWKFKKKLEFGMYPQSMPTEWTHARTVRPWQSVRLDL